MLFGPTGCDGGLGGGSELDGPLIFPPRKSLVAKVIGPEIGAA